MEKEKLLKLLKLAKKIKGWTELMYLDYDKKRHHKARYIDLYDWSCALVKELEKEKLIT